MECQRLLAPKTINNSDNESSEEDDWSDDGSSYSSYYSDSDSTIPDWEPYVDDFTGELLYIECHPFVKQNKESKLKKHIEPFSKNQMRRSTRDEEKVNEEVKKGQKPTVVNDTNTSKVKFQDFQEGEEKEVMLDIDAENRHNLSSDKSLAESLLGLVVSTLSDGNRVMIAGFSFDSKAKNERNIKIGDWLKSINNIEVNVHNLDDILQKFINRDDVLLKLQRVAGVEVTKNPPINELNNESNFVRELLNSKSDDEQLLLQSLSKHPVGIVYINTEKLSESNQENEDVTYCFPRPLEKNILCISRGIYVTLNHLLNEVTTTKPNITTIKFKDRLAYIVYTSFDENLLLFLLPDNRASVQEIVLINNEIIRLLQFCYETVDNCFTNEQFLVQVDHFFSRFFARVLSSGLWATAQQFVELQNLDAKSLQISPCQFEELLLVAPTLSLPDEAQMQIDDALTELEASDYREWNEEPLDCQRLFTVLGSALYHAGYLLATHLIHEDLMDVHCFCKQQGLFHLSRTEPVKSLVLWKEIFPYSCNRIDNVKVKVPGGKRYLLIVGSAKDLLAVIMEAGGCTETPEENMGPDAFYVEEAQATLAHLQELGLSELSERFLGMNPGPQIVAPIPPHNKRKSDFINLNFAKGNTNQVKTIIFCGGDRYKNSCVGMIRQRCKESNMSVRNEKA
ncbi:hypothetical protein NQ318_023073 [Aromia moschata]|uniref:Protein inturned n=1 Tax=Aromia moschata TaxID=1265417 RepID=A0AAV8XLX3_9CUCU|nr:hypothetical protein NQ318_023073 [Aromia moschata]